MNKNKNLGFTLAEVLIVIGIIGVVAALTLPNLNHATGDKEKVTKVKKIYSALTEAFDRAQVIYGNYDTWFNDLGEEDYAKKSERAAKRITEFMKVSKDCGVNSGCWNESQLLDFDNEVNDLDFTNSYSVILVDGTSLAIIASDNINIEIVYDLDGFQKGKYQVGNDIFKFSSNRCPEGNDELVTLYPGGVCPSMNSGLFYEWINNALEVTAWVIENENLDYLKCPDELNWETKTSCE